MRTTLRIDDSLLAAAKEHAARTGRTLTAVFEDAVRTFLTLQRQGQSQPHVELTTYGDGGLLPGVDLDDSASLQELMDGSDATG